MSFDVETARNELKNLEGQDRADNEEIRGLISQIGQKTITVTYENTKFRILATVPREIKELAFDLKRRKSELEEEEDITLDELFEPTYQILAKLCLDAPWNNPDTWRQVEIATGGADTILEFFLESIANLNKKVKKFR